MMKHDQTGTEKSLPQNLYQGRLPLKSQKTDEKPKSTKQKYSMHFIHRPTGTLYKKKNEVIMLIKI